jgi:hypothetical protein
VPLYAQLDNPEVVKQILEKTSKILDPYVKKGEESDKVESAVQDKVLSDLRAESQQEYGFLEQAKKMEEKQRKKKGEKK